ncbi:uncharacterized protein LOC107606856 [Arachis ipaensis]|uniref:uncharacterized protein LOC107606856 n=1 Tax=Arachis ipaensis TaxID=130454 RepID=UPI0007AF8C68|nr:uncharacterized protein LOC107606856 [Arachis ipaensis]XP_025664547.1 uncharacterized protein LOC112762970 [Arachis hypogaea]
MASPKTIKEVQQLAGRVAALSRFLPAVANRSYHFFQIISKNKKFAWTEECEKSFVELKQLLASPPILQRPETGKPLHLYLSVSNHAISSVLVVETGKMQSPVYFISRVLQPTETRYLRIEQPVLALVTTARRLRHYFQSHTIIVRTDQPLRQILTRPEFARRLIKWSIELSKFDIQYQSRKTLKSQILADFISEMTTEAQPAETSWSIHVEYEALLIGLKLAQQLKIPRIIVYCDSLLVVHQIKGDYQVKDPLLEKYWLITKDLISKFNEFNIIHVNREQNTRADVLSKLATTRQTTSTPALSQLTLDKPSFELNTISSIMQVQDWRTPFLKYINTRTVPKKESSLPLFQRRASFYTVIGSTLYRRGYSQPLLKCISKDEAEEVMAKTHEGVCGNHIGGRALAAKILQIGYYWPTIKRDCILKVKACNNQKHATVSEIPSEKLHTVEVSWPFDKWELDILRPFPKVPGQVKFLLVSIDYFSKWIEAQPLAHITVDKVRSFLWKNIICRYGIPREIISDNGRQFTDHKLASFLTNFNIKYHFSSVEHPQTNGQIESANRIILQGLKKKLGEAKGE